MRKTIAYASAMAVATATFLGQVPNVWMSQISEVPILSVFSPDTVQAAQRNISIVLNGNTLVFTGAQPQMVNNSVLVPARGVFQSMGFQAEWNDATKTSTLKKDGFTIVSKLGASYFTVNGNQKPLDVQVQIIDGTLMLPLRAISEATGAQVNWDANTSTVTINTNGQSTPAQPQVTPAQPSPGRLEVEDIVFDGYVINKVNVGNGVTLCKGDTREVVESLLGKPDRDTLNNQSNAYGGLKDHNFWYDDLNLYIRYNNEGLLYSITLKNSNHSFMGYKIGDPFSLDQELRSYEQWNSGLGYAWPDIKLSDKNQATFMIGYYICGNTTLTNEPKPTSIMAIDIHFYS